MLAHPCQDIYCQNFVFPNLMNMEDYVDIISQISSAGKHLFICLLAILDYSVNCPFVASALFFVFKKILRYSYSFYMMGTKLLHTANLFSVFSLLMNFIYYMMYFAEKSI